MGRLSYPQQNRKFTEGEEYVAMKELRVSGKVLKAGDRIDITKFSRLRLRQLIEWNRIVPRWRFEECMGIEPEVKAEEPKKKVRKKVSKKQRIDHGISA
jgi:hypothetical protein